MKHRKKETPTQAFSYEYCEIFRSTYFEEHLRSSEFVPLTISYHVYFLRISKVSSMLHHRTVGKIRCKECYLHILSLHFLLLFIKKYVFLSFSFLFLLSIELPQKNSHRSETGIGDKKLSVELYVTLAMDIMISISHGESTFGFCHQILIKL